VSAVQRTRSEDRIELDSNRTLGALITLIVPALFLVHVACAQVQAQQTRAQCEQCCKSSGLDDYYLDQCRLKCFRSPDHCAQGRAPREEAARPQRPVATPGVSAPGSGPAVEDTQEEQAAPPQRPAPPRQAAPRPVQKPAQPKQDGIVFRWPDPLSLTPGKEIDAARDILAANDIPPQHPRYGEALQGVQQVLLNFMRSNPQGGQMPTRDLVNVLMRFK